MDPKKTAEQILHDQVASWGQPRNDFPVDISEMTVLLDCPDVQIVVSDKDNKDGTFYNEVIYQGKTFMCSSPQRLHKI